MRYLDSRVEWSDPTPIEKLSLATPDDVLHVAEVAHTNPDMVIRQLLGKETPNLFPTITAPYSDHYGCWLRLVDVLHDDLVSGGKAALTFMCTANLPYCSDLGAPPSQFDEVVDVGSGDDSRVLEVFSPIELLTFLIRSGGYYQTISWYEILSDVTKSYEYRPGFTMNASTGTLFPLSIEELCADDLVDSNGLTATLGTPYKYFQDKDSNKRIHYGYLASENHNNPDDDADYILEETFTPVAYWLRNANYTEDKWYVMPADGGVSNIDLVAYNEGTSKKDSFSFRLLCCIEGK